MTKSRAETAVQTITPKSSRPPSTKLAQDIVIPKSEPPPTFEEIAVEDDVLEMIEEKAPSSPLDQLLEELRAPLQRALTKAEKVLGEEEKVAQWLETQAKRRLLRLAERFNDELQSTEVRRASQPPSRRDSRVRDLLD